FIFLRGYRLLAESKAEASIRLKSEGLLLLEDSKFFKVYLLITVHYGPSKRRAGGVGVGGSNPLVPTKFPAGPFPACLPSSHFYPFRLRQRFSAVLQLTKWDK
ncbi:hypothetical protein, partial [Sphingobium sp. AM]|uniref:hypothetical protein n=1 Tax=Sphingobium sp. AM TaxID=1176302 RepID=UPI001C2009B0